MAAGALARAARGLCASARRRRRAGLSAPLSRFECQTALALKLFALPSMNGFGLRPLPAAISSMLRPEATERSWSRMPSSSPSRS